MPTFDLPESDTPTASWLRKGLPSVRQPNTAVDVITQVPTFRPGRKGGEEKVRNNKLNMIQWEDKGISPVRGCFDSS